jgi:hypothetical protein
MQNLTSSIRSASLGLPAALALACIAGLVACGGEDDDGVSFKSEIKPIFDQRCAVCHFSGNGYADLENPFNPDEGLVGSESIWYTNHGYGPKYNVLPYHPEQSYVLEKVTNPALFPDACDPNGECLPYEAGFHMPPAPRRLRPEQRDVIRQWIAEGADPTFYQDYVINILGNPAVRTNDACARAASDPGCIQCVSCHRADGPYAPYGFVPEVDLIDVTATYRNDMKLVVPGDVDASFMMMKVDADHASSEWGAPMPYGYESLSEPQVALLTQWILEGARNN